MLQKELAKRLRAQYDTKMDSNGWLEVSSDGIPLCRIKYNGQFLSKRKIQLRCNALLSMKGTYILWQETKTHNTNKI